MRYKSLSALARSTRVLAQCSISSSIPGHQIYPCYIFENSLLPGHYLLPQYFLPLVYHWYHTSQERNCHHLLTRVKTGGASPHYRSWYAASRYYHEVSITQAWLKCTINLSSIITHR
jgi:hypothetical protein